ncbi:hypothetical protein BFP70_16155 [Thioclava sp. SK-1]|nr:hypothetical protein BFP70_16155 [Thioclava sp. SK-1]
MQFITIPKPDPNRGLPIALAACAGRRDGPYMQALQLFWIHIKKGLTAMGPLNILSFVAMIVAAP